MRGQNQPRGGIIDINAADAAHRLGVTKVTATRWAKSGFLAGAWQHEPQGPWHIPTDSLDRPEVKAALKRIGARTGK